MNTINKAEFFEKETISMYKQIKRNITTFEKALEYLYGLQKGLIINEKDTSIKLVIVFTYELFIDTHLGSHREAKIARLWFDGISK